MKHSLVISSLFLNLFLATTALSQSEAKIEELKHSVVKVITSQQSGVGIIVGSSDNKVFILTAQHLIKDAQDIRVIFYETELPQFPATVYHNYNEELDFAVIIVVNPAGTAFPYQFPRLNSGDVVTTGTKVVTIGHANDRNWLYQRGEIKSLTDEADSQQFLHDAPIERGDSGAPVFDEGGILLGMITKRARHGIVPARRITGMLQVLSVEWKIPTSLVGSNARPVLKPGGPSDAIRCVPFLKSELEAINQQMTKLRDLIAEAKEIEKEANVDNMLIRYNGWRNRCNLVL